MIDHYPLQPAPEWRIPPKLANFFERGDEGFLRDFLGKFPAIHDAHRDREGGAVELAIDSLARVHITPPRGGEGYFIDIRFE